MRAFQCTSYFTCTRMHTPSPLFVSAVFNMLCKGIISRVVAALLVVLAMCSVTPALSHTQGVDGAGVATDADVNTVAGDLAQPFSRALSWYGHRDREAHCGEKGNRCCQHSRCKHELKCRHGKCRTVPPPCGGKHQRCCTRGSACKSDSLVCKRAECVPCGGRNQSCCAARGHKCGAHLECKRGKCSRKAPAPPIPTPGPTPTPTPTPTPPTSFLIQSCDAVVTVPMTFQDSMPDSPCESIRYMAGCFVGQGPDSEKTVFMAVTYNNQCDGATGDTFLGARGNVRVNLPSHCRLDFTMPR